MAVYNLAREDMHPVRWGWTISPVVGFLLDVQALSSSPLHHRPNPITTRGYCSLWYDFNDYCRPLLSPSHIKPEALLTLSKPPSISKRRENDGALSQAALLCYFLNIQPQGRWCLREYNGIAAVQTVFRCSPGGIYMDFILIFDRSAAIDSSVYNSNWKMFQEIF